MERTRRIECFFLVSLKQTRLETSFKAGGLNIFMYFLVPMHINRVLSWLSGKESACQCERNKRHGFNPWVGKIPWRRKWQPTPVFLPGESHGQRSLAGYRPWGRKESHNWATEHACMHTHESRGIQLQEMETHGNWLSDHWLSKCYPWTNNISISWELIRNANSPLLPWVYCQKLWGWAEKSMLLRPMGDSDWGQSLRTLRTVLDNKEITFLTKQEVQRQSISGYNRIRARFCFSFIFLKLTPLHGLNT